MAGQAAFMVRAGYGPGAQPLIESRATTAPTRTRARSRR